ncbi:hypothetical protein BX667DRAFT_539125 [Coemansia mojavensis]|nr:hypothetical protein BX667DRAFT_539125 [Coemansia mojavensis]
MFTLLSFLAIWLIACPVAGNGFSVAEVYNKSLFVAPSFIIDTETASTYAANALTFMLGTANTIGDRAPKQKMIAFYEQKLAEMDVEHEEQFEILAAIYMDQERQVLDIQRQQSQKIDDVEAASSNLDINVRGEKKYIACFYGRSKFPPAEGKERQ